MTNNLSAAVRPAVKRRTLDVVPDVGEVACGYAAAGGGSVLHQVRVDQGAGDGMTPTHAQLAAIHEANAVDATQAGNTAQAATHNRLAARHRHIISLGVTA